jgi:hypothetical protein
MLNPLAYSTNEAYLHARALSRGVRLVPLQRSNHRIWPQSFARRFGGALTLFALAFFAYVLWRLP